MVSAMGDMGCACEKVYDVLVSVLSVVQVNVQRWDWIVVVMMYEIPGVLRYSHPPWGRDKIVRKQNENDNYSKHKLLLGG